MGLRLKLNLVLILLTLFCLLGIGLYANKVLQDNAREEALDKARIMMESAKAVRQYTVNEIRPLLVAQQKRRFLPQTVPSYAAHSYVKELQSNFPEFNYKEATLNPTNPVDRATEWESDIINHFRNTKNIIEAIGERETATGRYLYLGHPIKITNSACLSCHSKPSNAPKTLIDTYGDSNGFGWKKNEIVGAQLVSVPMAATLTRAQDTFYLLMAALISLFVVLIALLNLFLTFIIKQ
ncbi:DUF3365 domain-containing protein [uncultured Cocleimonas sp.]|uniref:Tll0287-like domain-containing protein n=1 Tax=uncultured Cocleimonas sp. TaxID=1051587 RepID=UPI00260E696A|nr:DUF3365 domain-containing protein [uncultured Cocleimonas sp.]